MSEVYHRKRYLSLLALDTDIIIIFLLFIFVNWDV